MAIVYIGLGTNLGDKQKNMATAVQLLTERVGSLSALSSYIETAPWGFESSNSFLNGVASFDTSVAPLHLLRTTQEIETEMGRTIKGGTVYHDRIIDIDLLIYDQLIFKNSILELPHPLLTQREFVLAPLVEIAPTLQYPVTQKTIEQIYTEFKLQIQDK
jgi:2-amino-4-hydroxy-6-hydroxymethyldihydropteridine diphosphokinase